MQKHKTKIGVDKNIMHTTEKERLIYQMYIRENMTAEEIAEELGISLRSVRKYISEYGLYKSDNRKKK